MARRHDLDDRAHALPELAGRGDGRRIGVVRRCQDAPAVEEEAREAGIGAGILRARHRMGRDEMHALGQMRRHRIDHGFLDRADIGENRARLQRRRNLSRHGPAGADRHTENDVVGVRHGSRRAVGDLVAEAEFAGALPDLRFTIVEYDAAGEVQRLGGMGDGGTDQPDADDREPPEERGVPPRREAVLRGRHHAARNSLSAATTSRFCSSVPIVMRSAPGRP